MPNNNVLMFHSYKGGTGKSLISTNVAGALVNQGKKVAIFDFDFLGPGLFSSFQSYIDSTTKPKFYYLNDLIFKGNSNLEIEDVLIDISNDRNPPESKFYVALANPEPAEINNLARLNRAQYMEAFRKILMVQEYLFTELKIDYLIIDAGPGFRFDVANAMMISDVIISVMKPSESDVAGTKHLLKSISAFIGGRLQGLVINRDVHNNANPGIHDKFPSSDVQLLKSHQEEMLEDILNYTKDLNISLFGSIPCLCDVSRGENGVRIITQDFPDHIFSKSINNIIQNIQSKFK
jgi:cellulose biosynthesis protein BcsQ